MTKLIAAARLLYEVVLIDTAPLLPVTDAAVLAPRVDGVLVLARHGHTDVRNLQAAKDALHAVSGRILGSVMTMVPRTGRGSRVRRRPQKDARQDRTGQDRTGQNRTGQDGAVPAAARPQPTTRPISSQPRPQPAARQPSPEPRPP
jgi:non-specific protein-tyrosine kinase